MQTCQKGEELHQVVGYRPTVQDDGGTDTSGMVSRRPIGLLAEQKTVRVSVDTHGSLGQITYSNNDIHIYPNEPRLIPALFKSH